MPSNRPFHRTLFLAIAVLAFFTLASSGQQCAQVDDRVTGVENANAPGGQKGADPECIKACVEEAQMARDAEVAMHNENLEACMGDQECMDMEYARHDARMQEIAWDQKVCKSDCHEQGTGEGGQ